MEYCCHISLEAQKQISKMIYNIEHIPNMEKNCSIGLDISRVVKTTSLIKK
jgi:hypothetical protein